MFPLLASCSENRLILRFTFEDSTRTLDVLCLLYIIGTYYWDDISSNCTTETEPKDKKSGDATLFDL